MGFLNDPCLRRATLLFLYCCVLSNFIQSAVGAKSRHFKWDVEYMHWSPDGVEHVVMGINGQFPGPTIRARAGDTINVALTNKLYTEGVVIHWHGIRQIGTPWADGTASVSQCAINPGETFIYRFEVDKVGTYFYHGHYGMQRSAGLYGSLIVEVAEGEKELFQYDGEFNLLLSDWWLKNSHEQEVDLSSKPVRWIGEPQTLLINGRGQNNCSMAAHFSNSSVSPCKLRGNEQFAPQILHVHPNKTYRLRIASSTSLASLNLAIGVPVVPVQRGDGLPSLNQLRQNESRGTADHPLEQGVPTLITWSYSGNNVAVEGSWDNWMTRKILQRSGKDHSILMVLPSGIYRYKFIVDGKASYSPDLPCEADQSGSVCNILDVHDHIPENLDSVAEFEAPQSPESSYSQTFPGDEDFAKDPVAVPPQLHLSVLDSENSDETAAASTPKHVVLNHLFIEKGWSSQSMVALGMTHRYQSKYVTVVLYKPLKR